MVGSERGENNVKALEKKLEKAESDIRWVEEQILSKAQKIDDESNSLMRWSLSAGLASNIAGIWALLSMKENYPDINAIVPSFFSFYFGMLVAIVVSIWAFVHFKTLSNDIEISVIKGLKNRLIETDQTESSKSIKSAEPNRLIIVCAFIPNLMFLVGIYLLISGVIS